jgi:hypothetical protein
MKNIAPIALSTTSHNSTSITEQSPYYGLGQLLAKTPGFRGPISLLQRLSTAIAGATGNNQHSNEAAGQINKTSEKVTLLDQVDIKEFQVNINVNSTQAAPSTATLSDGGFVVSWEDQKSLNPRKSEIIAQIYNVNGTKLGGEFRVDEPITDHQGQVPFKPQIIPLENNQFFIKWQHGDLSYTKRYSGNGTQQGAVVHSALIYDSITYHQNGSFTEISGANAQQYYASGQKDGESITIQSSEKNIALQNGEFISYWVESRENSGLGAIRAQIYRADGDKKAESFLVSTTNDNTYHSSPSATALQNGGFTIVWKDTPPSRSSDKIIGKTYDAKGVQQGKRFQVSSSHLYNYSPLVTSLNKKFMISWLGRREEAVPNYDILSQIYDSNGVRQGNPFHVNTETHISFPNGASTRLLKDGGFFITWQGREDNSTYLGIFGQRFDINGTKIAIDKPSITVPQPQPEPRPEPEPRPDPEPEPRPNPEPESEPETQLPMLGIAAGAFATLCLCLAGKRRNANPAAPIEAAHPAPNVIAVYDEANAEPMERKEAAPPNPNASPNPKWTERNAYHSKDAPNNSIQI